METFGNEPARRSTRSTEAVSLFSFPPDHATGHLLLGPRTAGKDPKIGSGSEKVDVEKKIREKKIERLLKIQR